MGLDEMLRQQEIINEIITWSFFIIIPAFVGSYASDYMKTLKHSEMRVSLSRILISAALSCVMTFIVLEWLMDIGKKPIVPFISFVLGLLGFELLNDFSSIEGIANLVKKISNILQPLLTLIKQVQEVRRATHIVKDKKDVDNDESSIDKNTGS